MKCICKNEKLVRVIQNADRVTGKNLTLPILSNILLIAKDDYLLIRATNLNIGVEYKIEAKVEIEGTVAVKGDIFSSVLGMIPKKENITLSVLDDFLKVESKQQSIDIKTILSEDFPTIPYTTGESFKIDSEKLIKSLSSVMYNSSISDIKPEIASVYLYSNNGFLYSVSTDSFRLGEKKIPIKNIPDNVSIILPIKNCADIVKILANEKTDLTVFFTKNQISIKGDDLYITSRVIDGIYPDYKQIIPKEVKTSAIVLTSEILEGLKLGSIVSDKFNQAVLNIDTEQKSFFINTKNNDTGCSDIKIDGTIKGEKINASYNLKYLIECLSNINTDSVSFEISDPNRPLVLKPIGDDSFVALVMPMNR